MAIAPIGPGEQHELPVENCDVQDRNALVRYRAKRRGWLRWYELQRDEPNSIQQQIFNMMFLDMAYRILAEPRRNGNRDLQIAARSGLLAHLLDQGYVATQVLAIRRLLDKRKDVVSLRRLFDDIVEHKHLLSREIYVCHDGTPYDPSSWQALPQDIETRIWGIEASGLSNYLRSRYRHEMFDRLSSVVPLERQRHDLIGHSAFNKVRRWLETDAARNS